MRTIKFRAWDKKGRFDMSNVLIIDWNEKYIIPNSHWDKDRDTGESDCVANFDEVELMQFTGLLDKNGTEIYEGDVVKVTDDNDEVEKLNSDTGIGIVEWLDKWYFWNVSKIENGLGDLNERYQIEVIGNIYESPELLEKK